MTTGEVFKKIDTFGSQLPSFNLKGNERVNTIVGGFFTLIIILLVFTYATLKFSNLITKPGPIINSYDTENSMAGVKINLNEKKYRLAFTIESY